MFERSARRGAFICVFVFASAALAQPDVPPEVTLVSAASGGMRSTPALQPAETPAILGLANAQGVERRKAGDLPCMLGDTIRIQLSPGGLQSIRERAEREHQGFGLLLDGRFLKDAPAYETGVDELSFVVSRTSDNQALWNDLLGGHLAGRRSARIDLGLEGGTALTGSKAFTLSFRALSGAKAVVVALAALAFLVLTIALARSSAMLRDGSGPTAGVSWSLGRVQMAFWFVNVVLAFLLVWAGTGATPDVTPSVLALLGIGAGTALGASVIDAAKEAAARSHAAQPAAAAAPPAPAGKAVGSDGFLLDLLRDHDTISFHRYQMAIWTVVLGFVFWGSVWHRLAMPDFDATFLALQGITAGTYLGFKLPGAMPATP